jgi:uncharacterized protein (TIGR02466 family)
MGNYNQVLKDTIFPSFIWSCIPDVSLKELEKEVYEIKGNYESEQKSNMNGYQSPVFDNDDTRYNELNKLNDCLRNFSQDIAGNNGSFKSSSWWININKAHDYNLVHTHYSADLIGIYYISIPEDSGTLTLLRKDGMEYSRLFRNSNTFSLNADAGRLYIMPGCLWHYVTSNQTEEDRISVSFNIYFDSL